MSLPRRTPNFILGMFVQNKTESHKCHAGCYFFALNISIFNDRKHLIIDKWNQL